MYTKAIYVTDILCYGSIYDYILYIYDYGSMIMVLCWHARSYLSGFEQIDKMVSHQYRSKVIIAQVVMTSQSVYTMSKM